MKRSLIIIFIMAMLPGYAQQRGNQNEIQITIDGNTEVLYEESHALLIGVSDYTHGWPDLPPVASDISAVQKALEETGFHVVTLLDPTSEQLKDGMDSFIAAYCEYNARMLIFFSGHGHTLDMPYGGKMGYIVPADAPDQNIDLAGFKDKAISMNRMDEWARLIESKHALFIFDCCFSGNVFSQSKEAPAAITERTGKPVRQFITAGDADERVPAKSIFCRQFLAGIAGEADGDRNGYVTGKELGYFLYNNVVELSKRTQHPQYGEILDPNLNQGDFVFIVDHGTEPKVEIIIEEIPIQAFGIIKINTEISGKLYLDDRFQKDINANTIITLRNIPVGNHKLSIKGDKEWSQDFMVYKDQEVVLTVLASIPITPNPTTSTSLPKDLKRYDEMIFIKGGCFMMGSNEGDPDEKPVHRVCVDDFYIGKYEVTQKQWREVMGTNPSHFKDCDSCPVESVSWKDTQEFIKKLNQLTNKTYRLPTEAEWEYAARGGSLSKGYKYSGSNNIDDVAWYGANSSNKTQPVGQRRANELGVFDMSGNVWEWCADWYGEDYYRNSPESNPEGPETSVFRCLRGGAWGSYGGSCRTSNRGGINPAPWDSFNGFRLTQD